VCVGLEEEVPDACLFVWPASRADAALTSADLASAGTGAAGLLDREASLEFAAATVAFDVFKAPVPAVLVCVVCNLSR
jgi:hypothetical protein